MVPVFCYWFSAPISGTFVMGISYSLQVFSPRTYTDNKRSVCIHKLHATINAEPSKPKTDKDWSQLLKNVSRPVTLMSLSCSCITAVLTAFNAFVVPEGRIFTVCVFKLIYYSATAELCDCCYSCLPVCLSYGRWLSVCEQDKTTRLRVSNMIGVGRGGDPLKVIKCWC